MAMEVSTAVEAPQPRKSKLPGIFGKSMIRGKGSKRLADDGKQKSTGSFIGNIAAKKKAVATAQASPSRDDGEPVIKRQTHPAYGLPGEDIPKFTDLPDQLSGSAITTTREDGESDPKGKGKRRDLSNLLDLEQNQAPEWKPLFADKLDKSERVERYQNEVPDVYDWPGNEWATRSSQSLSGEKGKGKEKITNESTESFQSAAESVSEIPKGLPQGYQTIAGKSANNCPHYNYASLYNGRKVRELWNPAGDTLVYLCAKNTAVPRGPSFLVDSLTLQSTSDYWVVAFSPVWQGGFDIDKVAYPSAKYTLFFAPDRLDGKSEETDPLALLRHYITMRNVFACMFDSYCVGLVEDDSPLLTDLIDRMLMYFEGAEDTLGQKLAEFIIKSGLWDVSNDPTKAVDLLHLANTYEITELYHEAFAHCVGMWPQIFSSKTHEVLSPALVTLLTVRHAVLANQLAITAGHLKKFNLKALWSTKSPATKLPRTVRQSFELMRSFLFKYYSNTMGSSWPPKNFISRPVFSKIYTDFCALYALMVDKQYTTVVATNGYPSLLPYVRSLNFIDDPKGCGGCGSNMPYGIPLLPGHFLQIFRRDDSHLRRPENYHYNMNEKLSDSSFDKLMSNMYNLPTTNDRINAVLSESDDFVKAFMGFERSMMKGKTFKGIVETRKGVWLMVYAILSLMAETSVEEGVVFKDGVEYFLCVDPMGTCPWEEGRRERDAKAARDAAGQDGDVDGWSVASLEGTGEQEGETSAAAVAEEPAAAVSAPEAPSKQKMKRAEMSFPWTIIGGPDWQGESSRLQL